MKNKQFSKNENRETVASIFNVFREHGFEGTSLSLLSQATGLQRASLYHHFPGGKEGMALAAIDSAADILEEEIFTLLKSDNSWQERLQAMNEQLENLYNGGRTLCLFTAFSYESVPRAVRLKTRRVVKQWEKQLTALIIDAGHSEEVALEIAEQMLVEIQGGLVVSMLKNDVTPFRRVLDRLSKIVLETPIAK